VTVPPDRPAAPAAVPRAGARPSLRKALVVFESQDYRFLWASSAFSFLGMQMQIVARGLLAWQLTESFGAVGAISLSFGLPMLLFSLVGGAVADRVNKRNLSLFTQGLTAVLALIPAALVATDLITIEFLFAVGLIQGTSFAFNGPARTPLMAQVLGPERLMSGIALSNAAMNGARVIGPAIAGALAVLGIEVIYFAQALMYVGSVACLLAVPASRGRPIPLPDGRKRPGMVSQIRDGLRYVVHDRVLRQLMLLAFIPTLFGMPYMMLLPGFVQRDLGQSESAYGYLLTVSGIGALVGSLFIASLSDFPRKPLLQLAAGVASGGGLILLALLSGPFGFAGAVLAILLLGLVFTSYQTLNNTMVMNASRPEVYGRGMSIYMLTFSVMPLMAAPLGALADVTGAPRLFFAQGCLVGAGVLLVALSNPRYTFGRTPEGFAAGAPMSEGGPAGPAPDTV